MDGWVRILLTASYCSLLGLGCSSSSSDSKGGAGAGNPFGNAQHNGSRAGSGAGSDPGLVRADGVGEPCSEIGAMRMCCDRGQQSCMGEFEFMQWGECVADGETVTCTRGGDECSTREFSAFCDGGTPPPPGECDETLYPGCNSDGGTPPPPSLCTDKEINNEPEILAGYSPAMAESVSQGGQIIVWENDEWPELIAPNEQIDATTGAIVTPGDRTAKAPDGYLYEPALYIAPLTAESGGPPHFPQLIKGWYNNVLPVNGAKPKGKATALGSQGASVDAAPAGVQLREKYTTELVWNVDALGLGPGTYMGEFVILDGDLDRAIGCVTIVITR